jgi:hypothetical protein
MAVGTGDRFLNSTGGISDPGWDAIAISGSGSSFTYGVRALYVGGLGDVEVVTAGGNTVKFTSVPAGTILPIRCTKLTTNTTASGVIAFI